eukprot:366531-Chlamydomonas_euryale.AAC.3
MAVGKSGGAVARAAGRGTREFWTREYHVRDDLVWGLPKAQHARQEVWAPYLEHVHKGRVPRSAQRPPRKCRLELVDDLSTRHQERQALEGVAVGVGC